MGITQQIGASSIIKPGVIDNTAARPASPYEGQVIFQKDTDQLLVWNGTAWVIPNAPTTNPTGLEYVTSATVGTGVSSVTVSGAFSSTYDNYKIILSGGVVSSAASVTMQLNNSTGSTYAMFGYFGSYNTATLNAYGPATTTLWSDIGASGTAGYEINLDIFSPFLTKPTLVTTWSTSTAAVYNFAGRDTATVSNTGFTITCQGGATFTGGTITVYGYRKA